MTVYDRLTPPYAEQKAQGLKPKGRCSVCGREGSLRADNTVAFHNEPDRGYKPFWDRGRKTTGDRCDGSGKRTANLATVRVVPPLTLPEAELARKAVQRVLNDQALAFVYDRDERQLLTSVLAKLDDPAHETQLQNEESERGH